MDVQTGGGAGVEGNATPGGDFIGRDRVLNSTVNVSVDALSDLRTDVFYIKKEIEQIKFSGWERKNQMDVLSSKVDALESKIAYPSSNAAQLSINAVILLVIGILGFAIALIFLGVWLGRLA